MFNKEFSHVIIKVLAFSSLKKRLVSISNTKVSEVWKHHYKAKRVTTENDIA